MDDKHYYELIRLCKATNVKRLGVNKKTFTDFISVFGKKITDESFRTFRRSGSFTLPVSFVVDGVEVVEIIVRQIA